MSVCVLITSFIVSIGEATAGPGETVLYAFAGGSDGATPFSNLIADGAGNLYGTTSAGGGGTCQFGSCGTVFKVAATGAESVLYAFTGGNDGAYPSAGLVSDSNGNLYGTASAGGSKGDGTVFKITPDGTESTLYSFQGGSDGDIPGGSLIIDQHGNLYGTTAAGGSQGSDCNSNGCGTVFELTSTGKETVLYAFKGGTDGWAPVASLTADNTGNLYGATALGGGNCPNSNIGCGTVFKVALDGTETQLHVFQGGSDGAFPHAGMITDAAGNFYGTTAGGGGGTYCIDGCGTIYKLSADGTETVLYSFQAGNDGWSPEGPLTIDQHGNLYGTTYFGGSSRCHGAGCGTVFRLAPDGTKTILIKFGTHRGTYPAAGLFQGRHGLLYGTTSAGGASNDGVVFSVKK